jgi:hypothetical protein
MSSLSVGSVNHIFELPLSECVPFTATLNAGKGKAVGRESHSFYTFLLFLFRDIYTFLFLLIHIPCLASPRTSHRVSLYSIEKQFSTVIPNDKPQVLSKWTAKYLTNPKKNCPLQYLYLSMIRLEGFRSQTRNFVLQLASGVRTSAKNYVVNVSFIVNLEAIFNI